MEEELTKKYDWRVINAFGNVKWEVDPTSHDADIILRLMQRMYDCGHTEGYSDAMRDHQFTNGDALKALKDNLQML